MTRLQRVQAGVAAAACVVLAAVGISAPRPATSSEQSKAARSVGDLVRIAPGVTKAGSADRHPPSTADCENAFRIACYGARQIEHAYDLPALYRTGTTGRGRTIVIVDPFGSPTIAHDLAVFDRTYKLPDPPSLRVVQPAGTVRWVANDTDEGWAGETTLDVEYSHAIAPGANILLVETPVSEEEGTTGFPQIVTAEKYVIDHHLGDVISQSFSATEQTFPSRQALLGLRSAYLDAAAKGVTVLTASGDSGAADVKLNETDYYLHPVTSWPDSDPLVTGVGGTELHLDAAGDRTSPDTVWNDTYDLATQEYIFGDTGPNPLAGGGGRSIIFARPDYQNGVSARVGTRRGVPDVSMSGACDGAVNTYQSYPGEPTGWYPVCGTSESTPLFAGIVALAAQTAHRPLGLINPALYRMSAQHAPGLVDVTSGNNTVSFPQHGSIHTVRGFAAEAGYDLASGVGTVDAKTFVPALASASAG